MTNSRSSVRPLSLLAAAFVICTCGYDYTGQAWGGSADTLGSGTIVMRNPASGLWRGGANWRVEEVLRIGRLEGPEPDVFGSIRALEVDRAGNILVFDHFARELRAFSSDGRYLWTRGRAGAGPGEFQGVIGMSLHPGGDLWIVDAENARYTVMQPSGRVTSFRRPATMYRMPWVGGFDGNAVFHDQVTERDGGTVRDLMLRVREDGEVADRFALPRVDLVVPRFGSMDLPLPFAPQVLSAWDSRGAVWQAVSSDYRLTRIELAGDTSVVVMRAFTPRPLALNERDSVESYVRTLESQFGITVRGEARPSSMPPLRWFVVDDQQNLWVCATGVDPCSALDVFDQAGMFLGVVALPARFMDSPRPIIRGRRIYAAVDGDTGEPQVFVGRVVDQQGPLRD